MGGIVHQEFIKSCNIWRKHFKEEQGIQSDISLNPLTPELNLSAQRFLTRFSTDDFASLTVHLINICVKNQQIHQLFIQFINYGSSYMFWHYIAIFRERS
jgi:hypothetical protein